MARNTRRKLAAILVADVVGYSRFMGEDETGTLDVLRAHREELIEPKIAEHEGRIVKLMGDGLLAEFPSAVEAVQCAVEIQRALSERNVDVLEERRITYRIGINIGDIIVEGEDIYGDGVNIAARLEGVAEPGGISISRAVHTQIKGKVDLAFEDLGEQEVKNIAEPVHVYRVGLYQSSASSPIHRDEALPLSDRPSIAVLPFVNMSGDPEQEYFSDGITEDIITDLSRVSGLFVVARTSVFTYKGKTVKVQRISEDLGVRYVLEGSVRKAGNRVRITAQMVDGTTGGHVWADRYDRDLIDIFEVQDDIAENIVEALKVAMAPREKRAIRRIPTTNMEAYQFYLRGRQFLHAMTRKNLELARQMFSKAIELDGDYVHAYAGLADCGSVLYLYYAAEPNVLNDVLAVSRKALELEPGLAEAHVSHGVALSLSGDDAGAEKEFDTAIRLDPMLYEAYWFFGLIHVMRGEFERSASLFEQASQVRGDDLQSMMMLKGSYQGLGRHADAKSTAERTLRMAERRFGLNPDDARAAYVGAMSLVTLGNLARARDWVSLAAEIESEDPRTNYNLACVYSLLGESDKALDYLELSIRGGRSGAMIGWVEFDPDLEQVRSAPRFKKLLKEWAEAVAPPLPPNKDLSPQ